MDSDSVLDPSFCIAFRESALKCLIRDAHTKAQISAKPYKAFAQRHQENHVTLSKIFALETWRRRQHENLIRQLEHVTESLDAKLGRALKENEKLTNEKRSLEKELVTSRAAVNAMEQRCLSLSKINNDFKVQAESLVNSLVVATNDNKAFKERELQMKQKLAAAEARVSQLLTIKSERAMQTSRYLPVRSAEITDVCQTTLAQRSQKKRELLDASTKQPRARRLARPAEEAARVKESTVSENDGKSERSVQSASSSNSSTTSLSLQNRHAAVPRRTPLQSMKTARFAAHDLTQKCPSSVQDSSDHFSFGSATGPTLSASRIAPKLDAKLRQMSATPADPRTIKTSRQRPTRARRIDAAHSSTILDSRTPLRDRLRSRTKKP